MADINKTLNSIYCRTKKTAKICAETIKDKTELMMHKNDLKKQITLHQKTIEEQYSEIGRSVYGHYLSKDGPLDVESYCESIKANQEMIEQYRDQLDQLANIGK